jgi:hypothetical protein
VRTGVGGDLDCLADSGESWVVGDRTGNVDG